MVLIKTDPVLMVVGLILAVAVIGWIAAAAIVPTDLNQKTKCTFTGKTVGGVSCCDEQNQQFPGCNPGQNGGCQGRQAGCDKTCNKNTVSSCTRG